MNFTVFLKLYAIAVVVFFLIDLAWLGVVARSFYQEQMGHLMRTNVNWAAAIAFYLIFVVGIIVLAVWPAVERQSFGSAVVLGALLGLVTYAAYRSHQPRDPRGLPDQGGDGRHDLGNGALCRGERHPYLASARVL